MKKIKIFIIGICIIVIDKLMNDSMIIPLNPEFEKQVDELVKDVVICESICSCPQGSTCEFFDEEEECCFYGEI